MGNTEAQDSFAMRFARMTQFATLDDIRAQLAALPATDAQAFAGAQARNGQLTKPPGALGRLEDLAIWYAGWRGTDRPSINAPQVVIFAGNHGVAARGVSAFPPEVTAQMVLNFEAGGAAINDFTAGPAMSEADFCAAISAGWDAVDPEADLFVTGEMGIANTTAAAAICTALYGGALDLKTQVVADGVALHGGQGDGLETLRRLGGRELAAMAGAILRARVLRIPVILDGFICCAAAACLAEAAPGALEHAVAGHQSAEGAHAALLGKLDKAPLVSLGLRLGEGSGAALAIGVLQGAIACHSGMATFAEAGVSDG